MKAAVRFWRCSRRRKTVLLQAGGCLILIRIALPAIPFSRIEKFVRCRPLRSSKRREAGEIISAIETLATHASATCLVRALAAVWLLRANGHDSLFQLGVARSGDLLQAHAWIEIDGQAKLGGNAVECYAKLRPVLEP